MLLHADTLPEGWKNALAAEFRQPYIHKLQSSLRQEFRQHQVFPPEQDVFNALKLTPLSQIRVVILGQDPYHNEGQAHGLSFSVRPGVRLPASLRNIFKELHTDLDVPPPAANDGCLQSWAEQGVLLLNTVLTVRAHTPGSHRGLGWEQLTSRIIDCANQLPAVAFVLWGSHAGQHAAGIAERHLIVSSPHPSPLSARRGFFGSRPFSSVNQFLLSTGQQPVDWRPGGTGFPPPRE